MSETIITTESVPSHQHTPMFGLVSSMRCEDCEWTAGASDAGWIACQAIVHLSRNPGHRLMFREPDLGVYVRADQLPRGFGQKHIPGAGPHYEGGGS
jgi:hypothetical protein